MTRPARRAIAARLPFSRGSRAATLLALTLLAPALAAAGCSSAASHPATTGAATAAAGGYPSYLPSSTLHVHSDAVLTGTVGRPALTVQGDGVRVKTPGWTVMVTVSGPVVPGEGLPYTAPATTCTWTVTMSGATGPVPLAVAEFTSLDKDGNLYKPAFVPGQPRPPAVLRPGQQISFELRAYQATGEGLMRWAPDGRHIAAKWDFVVEND